MSEILLTSYPLWILEYVFVRDPNDSRLTVGPLPVTFFKKFKWKRQHVSSGYKAISNSDTGFTRKFTAIDSLYHDFIGITSNFECPIEVAGNLVLPIYLTEPHTYSVIFFVKMWRHMYRSYRVLFPANVKRLFIWVWMKAVYVRSPASTTFDYPRWNPLSFVPSTYISPYFYHLTLEQLKLCTAC
jgi:hypothetical protein